MHLQKLAKSILLLSFLTIPLHQVSREEIQNEVRRIVETLKIKEIEIAVLTLVISPRYASLGLDGFIKEELFKIFSGYGN